jgi:predicted ester cyclase
VSEPAVAAAENLPKPRIVTVATKQPARAVEAEMLPARRYYGFWTTGDEHYAIDALAPDFIDLNLPEGRPQGPQGPLVASRGFREAVPDLEVTVEHAWIAGDQIISQLHFSGHFTDTSKGAREMAVQSHSMPSTSTRSRKDGSRRTGTWKTICLCSNSSELSRHDPAGQPKDVRQARCNRRSLRNNRSSLFPNERLEGVGHGNFKYSGLLAWRWPFGYFDFDAVRSRGATRTRGTRTVSAARPEIPRFARAEMV